MPVLSQQGVGILASSILALVLAKVPHQEVGLLLVVAPSEQALHHHQNRGGKARNKEKRDKEEENTKRKGIGKK